MSQQERGHKRKSIIIFLAKLFLATVLSLGMWEILLSNFYYRKPLSVTHSIFGRIPGPGLFVEGKEGYGRFIIDDKGLRIMPTVDTAVDAKNVLLLGDSFTLGAQVSANQTFAWLLQEQLGSSYKVINAGREGTSPNQYLGLSLALQEMFKPDIVVVQLNISDFTYDAFDTQQSLYFVKTDQGFELKRNENFVSRSSLGTRLDALKRILNFSIARLALEKLEGKHDRSIEFRASDTRNVDEQQRDEATFIHYAVKELKATYGDPILIYLPVIDYFDPENVAPDFTEAQLLLATQKAGVRYVSMREAFLRSYTDNHRIPTGFANSVPGTGHMNALGHELVATEIYKMITEKLATQ